MSGAPSPDAAMPADRSDPIAAAVARLELSIPAEVRAIGPIVDRVMALLVEVGCVVGREDDVDLSLREALTNAVAHGNRADPRTLVSVSVRGDAAGGVAIVVRDIGRGFDPAAVPSPATRAGRRKPHGRGIFLIRRLMDEVTFARGGTEIRMWCRAGVRR